MPSDESSIEQLFLKGSDFDARKAIKEILAKARHKATIIDRYVLCDKGETVSQELIDLLPLDKQVEITIITKKEPSQQKTQSHNISFVISKDFHDRFIIVDDTDVWHLGASIKDAGKKACMLNQIMDSEIASTILSVINELH